MLVHEPEPVDEPSVPPDTDPDSVVLAELVDHVMDGLHLRDLTHTKEKLNVLSGTKIPVALATRLT
jgi:hypothetical protein